MTGMTAAIIYKNGVTLDTSNNVVIVAQNLLGAGGYGLANIAITNSGAGYIGAPAVVISGGAGTGATAYAQIDMNPLSARYQQVTNIVIATAGSGYLSNDNVSILLQGGGFLQAAQLGAFSFGVNATDGGLTKLSNGTLVLTGNNTYAGPTTVSNGVLQIGAGDNSGTLGLGAVTNLGLLVFNRGDTLYTNTASIAGTGAVISIGTGVVTFAGANAYGGGTRVSNGVLQFNSSASVPSAGLITVASNGVAALNFAGIQATLNSQFNTTNTFGSIALAEGSANDASVDFAAASLSNAWLGAVGAVNFTGVFTPFGSNYQFGGGGVLTITNILEDDLVTPANRNVLIGGGGPAGVVVLLGTNFYHGITVINSGTLRADEDWGLHLGNLAINGGILEISTNFNRALGTDLMQVQLTNYAGFSSFGGTGAVINLNGDGSMVTWGAAGFAPTNFVLNAVTASTNITFVNGLNLGGLNRTVSVYALTATMSGNITNGTLTKGGSGTLILTGNNGNGATYLNSGTLKIGANNTLFTNSMLFMGDVTNSPDAGGVLDLTAFSQTIGGLSVQTTNNFATNTINIGAGQQLTVLGNVVVGVNATAGVATNGGNVNMVLNGAGSFVVTGSSFRVSALDASAFGDRVFLDMSGLAAARINLGAAGVFQMGDTYVNNLSSDASTVVLASNTTLTAGNVRLGTSGRALVQSLRLGSGTNVLNVNTINLGSDGNRAGGSVVFNSATGSLVVRDATGSGRAALNVGAGNATTGNGITNVFDVTGHNVDLLLSTLTVGEQPRLGQMTNMFSFDTGVLDANTLRIGNRPSGQISGLSGYYSTVNFGGGTVNINSGVVMGVNFGTNTFGTNFATLNITAGTVTVGSNIVMLTQNSLSNAVYSTINLTGGSLTALSNIITGTTVANGTTRVATINLAGGVLDMTGHAIGTNNALINVLNFQSGTLQNVAQINNGGSGFVKSGSGTLTLAGSNAFSSSTVVTNGTLALAGIATGFGTLGVTGGTVNVTGTGWFNNVSVGASGTVNVSTGGVLRFTNSFFNGLGAALVMNGGLLTNAAATNVLTNLNTIQGVGMIAARVDNRTGAFLTATGGVLELTLGFWNAANYGALQAFGTGSILQIDQMFTNYGSIFTTNGGLVQISSIVNNTNLVVNNSTMTVSSNFNNNGAVVVTNGGTLNINGAMSNSASSSITVGSGSTVSASGNSSSDGSVTVLDGGMTVFDYVIGSNSSWTLAAGGTNRWTGDVDVQSVQRNTNFSVLGTWQFLPTTVKTQLVEVTSLRLAEDQMFSDSNMSIGIFMVGDAASGSNAIVRLVDQRDNGVTNGGVGVYNQVLAASNLIVALSGSILDWNNRSGFAYNLSNAGTMQWTNAGNPAGVVVRMDVVNTFTNQGTIQIGNGTALQFSNAFLNGPTWGLLSLFNGGVLTNFAAGSVLTNAGTIFGDGVVMPAVANNAGATVAANLGTLLLGGGLANNVNNGTLGTTNAGTLAVNSAVLTNASGGRIGTMGGVFTLTGGGSSNVVNLGSILGWGTNAVVVDNRSGGSITATGGTLRLTAGLTNSAGAAINAGLLAALGAGAQLNVAQAFTNLGTIQINNAAATFTAPRVDNAGNILGFGAFNAVLNNAAAGVVSNDGTGGTLTFNSAVANAGNMVALNNSGLAFAQAVANAGGGLIGAGSGGTVTFNAAVTNAAGGVLGMRNGGRLVFNAGLTNNGTLGFDVALNPSTAIITGTLLLGSSGTISMAHSTDTLVMRGDFVNGSTDTNGFGMRYGTMVFGGTVATVTNTFEVAGTNKGAVISGFVKNMALGTLNITNHVRFVDYFNNGGGGGSNEVLYVDVLHLFNGATLKLSALTIYVGQEFIYEDGAGTKVLTAAQTAVINQSNKDGLGLVNVFLDNGGQIVFIPEPSTGMLLGVGWLALGALRRRRKG
jgi:autotransporter-associated beta strand protein